MLGLRTWRLGDLGSKQALLRGGLGWGSMPQAMISDDLAQGRLVQLDVADGKAFQYPLYAINRNDEEPGPAGRWLMRQFVELDHRLPHDAY